MSVVDVFVEEISGLWSKGTGTTLAAVAVGWGVLNGVRMVYPVIIPHLQDAYSLTLTTTGLLVTVLWFFGSVGQLPSGILADRYSERIIMTISTVTIAFALTLVVIAPSTLFLFVATAVWGLGHSLYPIARITLLSKLYEDRLGSALGVTMATGDIGQAALPPIATALTAGVAWQLGLWFIVPILLFVGVIISLVSVGSNTPSKSADSQSPGNVTEIVTELRTASMGLMILILFLYLFIWQSFTTFYPTYLIETKGLSPSTASLLFGFFFVVGIVVKPISGISYDRIGMKKTLFIILLPSVPGFLFLPVINDLWLLVVNTAAISTMLGSGSVTHSYLADTFSDELQGTGLGVVRTLTSAVAAIGPVAFGVLGDNGYFDEGYIVLSAVMCGILVLIRLIPDSNKHS
jgi:MFS family permease